MIKVYTCHILSK